MNASVLSLFGETPGDKGTVDFCQDRGITMAMCNGVMFLWVGVNMVRKCAQMRRRRCHWPLVHCLDKLLLAASGLGLAGASLVPACYPESRIACESLCDRLEPVVRLSSALYFTHAGLLLIGTVLSAHNHKIRENASLEDVDDDNVEMVVVEGMSQRRDRLLVYTQGPKLVGDEYSIGEDDVFC